MEMSHIKELKDAVNADDFEKVSNLLSKYTHEKPEIVRLLTVSLKNGHRRISNLFMAYINYDLSSLVRKLALYAQHINVTEIIPRILDIFAHNNVTPTYQEVFFLFNLINYQTDKEIAKFLEYYLSHTRPTKDQYKELLKESGDFSETFNMITYYSQEKTKL